YGNGLQDQQLLARRYASVYTIPDITRDNAGLATMVASHRFNDATSMTVVAFVRRILTRTLNGDVNDDALGQDVYTLSAADKSDLVAHGVAVPATINAANTPFACLRCIAQSDQSAEPDLACNGLLNRSRNTQGDAGISAQATTTLFALGLRHELTAGGGVIGSRTTFEQSSELGYLNPDRSVTGINAFADGISGGTVDGTPLDTRVDLKARTATWSAFATDTVALTDRLFLTASARYNRTSVADRDSLHDAADPSSLDGDYVLARLNPALGLAWNVSPVAHFYVGYSEGSRTPTAIELGCANVDQPCKLPNALAGDPPLKQVVARTLEAEWRGERSRKTTWSAGVIRSGNDDDVLFVAAGPSGFGHFQNIGKTDNVLERRYAIAAQLGATAFDSSGRFVAQPFRVNSAGDYPLRGSTFFAPGSPRLFTVGVRYRFD
ncbi:MAG: TonB-dependent receptor, partial [Caldimonas sp.]